MRIRTIKPEFWTDPKIGKLSRDARLLFIGLWSVCDDFGACQSNFDFLKGQLFSYEQISSKKIQKWVHEFLTQNLILPFEANGDKYFHIKNFKKHQVVNRPSKFRNPEPPTFTEQSMNNHGLISQGGVMVMEGKGGVMVMEEESEEKPKESQPPFSLSNGKNKTEKRKYIDPNAMTPREKAEYQQWFDEEKDRKLKQGKEAGLY